MKKWFFVVLLAYQALAFCEPAAKVLFTSKDVVVKRNNQEHKLARGSELFAGNLISTREGALAQFQYTNGTVVSLQPNSDYTISAYNKTATSGNAAYLAKGGIESTTGAGKEKKSVLQTPVVALSISGTRYRASIFCNTATCKKFAIEVTEGLVIVDNRYYLGPGEQQNSAIYNANTKQITYGPINWSANGWVDFPALQSENGDPNFIDTSILTQDINATITNAATHTVTNSIVTIITTGACPCC
ncbi:MAG: FecR family protein [Proteobacteria bacterium]|nr:FecR family protein [Pseudomonadota bacterium]